MMLMKIGDAAGQFGISHRALHYWEGAGILRSSRAENDYRYYDEENQQTIRQIVLLRKLRLSIPSIREIFLSEDLAKIAAVFTAHLDETQKEREQLDALGKVLRQLINMLRDRQDLGAVYKYLAANHEAESEELKAALQTVLTAPIKEPGFSMGFDIAHSDAEATEAFAFYQKAFGAKKIAEFSPPGSHMENLHIIMEIHGISYLIHPVGYGEEREQAGGAWEFDSEDELRKVYDALIQGAQKYSMEPSPHFSASAFVTDKYGVSWWLHT
ncbi:MAG: MerR family transcriptional regulator [Oscillospiraceae bacterium]|jgi:DNA-binding transcriptional MerR regulator/uncharacterized glyoxalase superfamily protein PhnB|nr:MerR family transcriptional regulator [Oscillospiraceae bacterium]